MQGTEKALKRGLIVSCQALEDEPLHSAFIMSRMAAAACEGGAVGIRANSVEDIREIKKTVSVPIIGLIKKNYEDMKAYITPTETEVKALSDCGVDVIALDATINQDAGFLERIREQYPNQLLMADISTVDEGLRADAMGFDYVSTTLVGYTEHSMDLDKYKVLSELVKSCKNAKIIAEGKFNSPQMAASAYSLGAYAVVVGSAITRPQLITAWFNEAILKAGEER